MIELSEGESQAAVSERLLGPLDLSPLSIVFPLRDRSEPHDCSGGMYLNADVRRWRCVPSPASVHEFDLNESQISGSVAHEDVE